MGRSSDRKTRGNRKTPGATNEMVLTAPSLAQFPWLVHGFSTRRGGVSSFLRSGQSAGDDADLNLGKVSWDSAENMRENRRRLLARLAAGDMPLVMQRQIHSDLIRDVGTGRQACTARAKKAWPTGPTLPPAGDGLITKQPGLLLAVLVADCLPILLVDAKQRAVAALHCGWRGTARRLAEKAVGRMRMQFSSRPEDLWAAIGPGIRACCYGVGPEVAEEFASQFSYASKLLVNRLRRPNPVGSQLLGRSQPLRGSSTLSIPSNVYLDLAQANVQQLRDAGISAQQIDSEAPCVSCHPELFFSHRRDGGRTGRMMGVIGIREK